MGTGGRSAVPGGIDSSLGNSSITTTAVCGGGGDDADEEESNICGEVSGFEEEQGSPFADIGGGLIITGADSIAALYA